MTCTLQSPSCHLSHPECVTSISFYKLNRLKLDKNKSKQKDGETRYIPRDRGSGSHVNDVSRKRATSNLIITQSRTQFSVAETSALQKQCRKGNCYLSPLIFICVHEQLFIFCCRSNSNYDNNQLIKLRSFCGSLHMTARTSLLF